MRGIKLFVTNITWKRYECISPLHHAARTAPETSEAIPGRLTKVRLQLNCVTKAGQGHPCARQILVSALKEPM